MRRIRSNALGVLLLAGAVLAGPIHAGTKTKTLGNNKTGAYMTLNWLFKLAPKSAKSVAKLGTEIGARLFKNKFPVLAAGGRVGNYAAADLNLNKNKSSFLIVNKAKQWKMIFEVDLFGSTVYTKSKNFTHDTTVADYHPTFGKTYPPVPFSVGPIPFSIQYGANLSGSIKPKVRPLIKFKNGKVSELGVGGEVLPTVGVTAFVEGGPNIYFLRGGVGAELNLFKGSTGPGLELALLKGKSFALNWITKISILKGRLYAYVDRRKWVLWGSWKRWLDITIFNWNGFNWEWTNEIYSVTWDFDPVSGSNWVTAAPHQLPSNTGLSYSAGNSGSLVKQAGGIYAAPAGSGKSFRVPGYVPSASYSYSEKRWSRGEVAEYYRMKKEADAKRATLR